MTYNPDVYNISTDVKILQQRIEDNFDALIRNFEGSSPSVTYTGMWWYDGSYMKLRIPSGWSNVYDISTESVVIGVGSVGTAEISDSARKGTIVQGQNISPASCSLKAKPMVASYPGMPETDVAKHVTRGVVSLTTLVKQRVYVPLGATTVYMAVRAKRANSSSASIQFRLVGETSNSKSVGTSYSWLEASLNTGTRSGWSDLIIEANISGSTGVAAIDIQGYAFTSDES